MEIVNDSIVLGIIWVIIQLRYMVWAERYIYIQIYIRPEQGENC